MENILKILGNGLILSGTIILAFALHPVGRLLKQVPVSTMRSRWKLLAALIYFFILGYVIYFYLNWGGYIKFIDLAVPAIFFNGFKIIRFTIDKFCFPVHNWMSCHND